MADGVYVGSAAADLTSRATGTVPERAAAIAASLASTHTREPSVVTMYSFSSRYCMDSAEPPPVPSFHSRVPSAAKQYTEDAESPAKTWRPSRAVAQE